MQFKEWFKNKTPEAKKEAHELEKVARANLRGRSHSHLDALMEENPELGAEVMMIHPETNDENMNDFAAEQILKNPLEYAKALRIEDPDKDMILELSTEMCQKLLEKHAVIAQSERRILLLDQEIFILEQRIKEEQLVLIERSKAAFGHQDEFYQQGLRENEQEVQELIAKKDGLIVKRDALAQPLGGLKKEYKNGMQQYYALTGEHDPDEQERMESNN